MSGYQLIDRDQWDQSWSNSTANEQWIPIDHKPSVQDNLLIAYLLDMTPQYARVLEIGCGGSKFLPLLARRKQADIWGIDYSPAGIKLAQDGLSVEGVSGRVILGDVLKENELPKGYFDVILSFGVIEHFPAPGNIEVMRRFAEYACPGALIITEIPNIAGLIGKLTKLIDLPLYQQHVPLDHKQLDELHVRANLSVELVARPLGRMNIYVINWPSAKLRLSAPIYFLLFRTLQAFQKIYLKFRSHETPLFSPYIVGAYRKRIED